MRVSSIRLRDDWVSPDHLFAFHIIQFALLSYYYNWDLVLFCSRKTSSHAMSECRYHSINKRMTKSRSGVVVSILESVNRERISLPTELKSQPLDPKSCGLPLDNSVTCFIRIKKGNGMVRWGYLVLRYCLANVMHKKILKKQKNIWARSTRSRENWLYYIKMLRCTRIWIIAYK